MLERVLEPEVMDTAAEAQDYDAMNHAAVNQRFVDDLLAAGLTGTDLLDLGTGTAQIPLELCRRVPDCRVLAVDLAVHMLDLARYNIEVAGLRHRIELQRVDAKSLPFPDDMFHGVMSNSIVHHIPDPAPALGEAIRVAAPGGLIFVRDLARPADDDTVRQLVATYAGEENAHQQQMFEDSLRAALTLDEIRALVVALGFPPETVQLTSDRHWTWSAHKPGAAA